MASKKLKDKFAKWHRDYVEKKSKNFRLFIQPDKILIENFSKFSHSDFNVFKWNPNYSSLWLIKNVPMKIFVIIISGQIFEISQQFLWLAYY